MKTAAFIFLLFLTLRPVSQTTAPGPSLVWKLQTSGTLARLQAVFFTDRERGWAAGSNGTLLQTADGGATWQRRSLAGRASRELVRDLWFFNNGRGFLLGEYDLFQRPDSDQTRQRAFLLQTDDGQEWSPVTLPPPPDRNVRKTARKNADGGAELDDWRPFGPILLRFYFASERVGWACGETGTIHHTADGGATWRPQFTITPKLFYDVTALDEKQAWLVGGGGAVVRTVDGGQQWNEQPSDTTQTLRAVHFVDAKRGWAVGANGVIIATINGGSRWRAQTSNTQQTLNDVFFVNAREGWAAGERGTVLHTRDGGATWEAEELKTHSQLNRLFFLAPDCGWVVGTNGAIFKYGPGEAAPRPKLQ